MSATKYNYCLRYPSVHGEARVGLWVLDENCRHIGDCDGYITSKGNIKVYPKYYGEPFVMSYNALIPLYDVKTESECDVTFIERDIEKGYFHFADPTAALERIKRNCRELAEKAEQKTEYELIREKEKSPDWDPWEKIREMEKALGIICEDY